MREVNSVVNVRREVNPVITVMIEITVGVKEFQQFTDAVLVEGFRIFLGVQC